MSSFTTFNPLAATIYDPVASKVLNGTYWRNLYDFRYYIGDLDSNQWVDVKAGILSDGASVPFPINALIPAWGSYSAAVLLHDRLCNTYTKTVLRDGVERQVAIDRKEIDAIFDEAMGVLNVESWRRTLIMMGINMYRLITNPSKPKITSKQKMLEDSYVPV